MVLYSLNMALWWDIETARFGCGIFSIDTKFDRRPRSNTANSPVKFQSGINSEHSIHKLQDLAKSCDVVSYSLVNRSPGPLFTKRQDVLPLSLVKFRSREIGYHNDLIALKFRCLGARQISERLENSKPESHFAPSNRARSCGKTSVRLVNSGPDEMRELQKSNDWH